MGKITMLYVIGICVVISVALVGAADLPAGMKMVDIPGGTFEMGTSVSDQNPVSSIDDDENPVHTVNIAVLN